MPKIYPIVKYPDPVLLTPAEPVTEFSTPELRRLIEDMFASMYAAHGVGLAAPQIGISRRITVIDCAQDEQPPDPIVCINPSIIARAGEQTGEEGCLSLPGFRAEVTRARQATLRAQTAEGEWFERSGEDLLARAFQHELDHLDGKLFLARISPLKRDVIKRKIKKLQKAGDW